MEVTRKQSMSTFLKKQILLPSDTHPYACLSGDKKCLFFQELGVLLCFLVTSVLRLALFDGPSSPPFSTALSTGFMNIFELRKSR